MQNGMKTVEQLKKEVEETKLPQATKELFYKVLDTADESSLSESQRIRYESDLKNYMDTMSCIEFATIKGREEGLAEGHEKGLAEGLAEGKSSATIEIARNMKAEGMTIAMISKFTGLSAEEIGTL